MMMITFHMSAAVSAFQTFYCMKLLGMDYVSLFIPYLQVTR